ncbi:MAG TPA: chemotaxis protein CheD [Cyclobacteriaceae bacterium]
MIESVPVITKKYFITDGQFLITTVPATIHTVLGSCVSVCIWDKKLKLAGMNHYLMPGSSASDAGNPNHGYTSIAMLIRSMLHRHAQIENMEAKIFGGCNSWLRHSSLFSVGRKNIEVANLMLREAGIKITAQNTGGMYGRKIVFNTFTGKVNVHMLTKTAIEVNEDIYKGFSY